jgi:hypothetical protein
MVAEQATVFAFGPSARSYFKAAVAGLAFGTDDVGRPHVGTVSSQVRQPQGGSCAAFGLFPLRLRPETRPASHFERLSTSAQTIEAPSQL